MRRERRFSCAVTLCGRMCTLLTPHNRARQEQHVSRTLTEKGLGASEIDLQKRLPSFYLQLGWHRWDTGSVPHDARRYVPIE